MSELKPRITENGIDYILVGDYYIPDLKLPEEHRPIGKYGRIHREYLREVHPARLNTLILTGELWTYLADLNEQAQERLDTIMEQMKATEGVTEELKRTSQMEWVQRCNNIFKTAISVWMISNTFDIIMAVFDVTQQVVANSSGIISGNTRVNDIGLSMLQSSMMQMDVGPLFGLFLQSFFIGITMRILSIVIFVIVYGRMIEIYMMVSLAPVPMATWGNHEQSHVGQNYLRSLFALGFQGFLILICVAIYAVLLQNVAISGDAINSIWSIVGYTVLLCFSLFKTSSVAKTLLGAH